MFSLDDAEFWVNAPEESLPEIRVWADVMFYGLYDAACYRGVQLGKLRSAREDVRKDRAQAWWWLNETTCRGPGSFVWCCRLFNFDPDQTRSRLVLRWEIIVKNQQKYGNTKQKINNNEEES